MKVCFCDRKIWREWMAYAGYIGTFLGFISADVLSFDMNGYAFSGVIVKFILLIFGFIALYIWLLIVANRAKKALIDNSHYEIQVMEGDIFDTTIDALTVIGFNEYYDTVVDDKIISRTSLNGKFLERRKDRISKIDELIKSDEELSKECIGEDKGRKAGKKKKYRLGSMVVYDEYVLTAFTNFDLQNRANLTKAMYIQFLLHLWENLDRVYAGKNIRVPLFGSGITRFVDGAVSKQELLGLFISLSG